MNGDIVYIICMNYARSLIYGCDHLHQSLARLLSLWLDYGSRVASYMTKTSNSNTSNVSKEVISNMTQCLRKMNELIQKFTEKVPPYYFLSVFPQLTSRICHPHQDVWAILRMILIKTFLQYPHHVFWHMVAITKSAEPQRASRCKEIFDSIKSKLNSTKHSNFIDDGLKLADHLLEFCEKEKLPTGNLKLSDHMKTLVQLLSNIVKNNTEILIPTTKNMTVMLSGSKGMSQTEANPFQNEKMVFMCGIEDEFTVMKSLVRPKKITFKGSDGKFYSFLCKPKDDLRRDSRLLDFNNLLNKMFMKDPESRKRNLHITTYVSFCPSLARV